LPQPFALRLLADLRNRAEAEHLEFRASHMTAQEVRETLQRMRDSYPRLARFIPRAESRSVFFGLGERIPIDRALLAEGLRLAIPVGLVEDVRINGQSWDKLQ